MTNDILYIPRVFRNITSDRITQVFAKIGKIKKVDFVEKTSADGQKYNAVYIHLEEWYSNDHAKAFRDELITNKRVNLTYDKNWFWIVLMYNKKEFVPSTPPPMKTPEFPPKLPHKFPLSFSAKDSLLREQKYGSSPNRKLDFSDASLMFDDFPIETMNLVDDGYVKCLEEQNANLYKTIMKYHALCLQLGGSNYEEEVLNKKKD